MEIITLVDTTQRHANGFTDANGFTKNCMVFSAQEYSTKKVEIIVEGEHGSRTFAIYLNGVRKGASTNYPKAIGQAILMLNKFTLLVN